MSNPIAIVAEDEGPQRKELVGMLRHLWPDLTIAAQCESGAEALEAMQRLAPNVAFLDIQMPEVSGIDVARAATSGTNVVFVTAFDQFAVQAFEDGAIDYLLKPVQQDRLRKTIDRIRLHLDSPKDISAGKKAGGSVTPPLALDHGERRRIGKACPHRGGRLLSGPGQIYQGRHPQGRGAHSPVAQGHSSGTRSGYFLADPSQCHRSDYRRPEYAP
jgi:CheY-like chemotaxis protein